MSIRHIFNPDSLATEVVVEYGGQCPVVIDKLFGPACVCRVKVVLDLDSAQWVIYHDPADTWVEVARFPADYPDDPLTPPPTPR